MDTELGDRHVPEPGYRGRGAVPAGRRLGDDCRLRSQEGKAGVKELQVEMAKADPAGPGGSVVRTWPGNGKGQAVVAEPERILGSRPVAPMLFVQMVIRPMADVLNPLIVRFAGR